MKKSSKIYVIITILCLAFTALQYRNFQYVWKLYKTTKLFEGRNLLGYGRLKKSPFSEKTRKENPEAIAVFDYFYSGKNKLDNIAEMALQFPDNNFFKLEIAKKLTEDYGTEDINPSSAELIADKLIENDPCNAYCHYFKAYIKTQTTQNETDEILEEVKKANNCKEFYHPLEPFQNKLYKLLQKSGYEPMFFSNILWILDYSSFRQTGLFLAAQSEEAFKKPENQKALEITEAGSEMSSKLFDNSKTLVDMLVAISISSHTDGLQYKYSELPADEMQQIRNKLSANIIFTNSLTQTNQLENQVLYCTVSVSALIVFLFYLSLIVAVLIVNSVICLFRKYSISKVRISTFIYFALSIILIIFLLVLINYTKSSPENMITISLSDNNPIETQEQLFPWFIIPAAIWIAIWLLGNYRIDTKIKFKKVIKYASIFSVLLFISFFLAIVLTSPYFPKLDEILLNLVASLFYSAVAWILISTFAITFKYLPVNYCNKKLNYLNKNRIIQTLLFTLFFACLLSFLQNQILRTIAFLAFTASISIILTHPAGENLPSVVDFLIHSFGKSEPVRKTRYKITRLLIPYALFCFITSLISLAVFVSLAKSTITPQTEIKLHQQAKNDYHPDRQAYEKVVELIPGEGINRYADYIYIASPNDLPQLLSKLEQKDPQNLDGIIKQAIQKSPKQCHKYYLDYIQDNNSLDAVLARAFTRDISVKDRLKVMLEESWKDETDELTYFQTAVDNRLKGQESEYNYHITRYDYPEILEALTYVCEPDEIEEILINEINIYDPNNEEDSDIRDFYDIIKLLDRQQATRILKAYLEKTQYSDLTAWYNYDLKDCLKLYGDNEIAAAIFKKILNNELDEKTADSPHDSLFKELFRSLTDNEDFEEDISAEFRRAIAPLFDENSKEMFLEQLNNPDENIRAYCVWQLTRLNHNWQEEQIGKLINDTSWKVRANTLWICNKEKMQSAKNDENSFVKFLASALSE